MLVKLLFFLKMHLMKVIFKKTGNLKYHQSYVVQKINLNTNANYINWFILIFYPWFLVGLKMPRVSQSVSSSRF